MSLRRASLAILSDSAHILSSLSSEHPLDTIEDSDIEDSDAKEDSLVHQVDQVVEQVVSKIQSQKDLWEKKTLTPELIRTRDKITFVVSLISLVAVGMLLGHSPQEYYKINAALITVTTCIRTIRYRLKRWHWYILDFCYLVNLLLIIWCFYEPLRSLKLPIFRVLYAFSHGPLAIAIILFRNSFVLHSLDKTTSVIIHFSPCLCVYTLRWFSSSNTHAFHAIVHDDSYSTFDILFYTLIGWTFWACCYYVKCFVVDRQKAIEKKYDTLFLYVKQAKGNPMSEWVRNGKGSIILNPYVRYMSLHGALMLLSTSISLIWWEYFWLNTLFVCTVCTGAFWNGAGFYFVWFSSKYNTSVKKYGNNKGSSSTEGSKKKK